MLAGFVLCDSELSPNFEKKPFFLGCLASSFSPTSSKPSSAVGGCFSKCLSLIADRGSRGIRAESRLCRPFSDCMIGERADISYGGLVSNANAVWLQSLQRICGTSQRTHGIWRNAQYLRCCGYLSNHQRDSIVEAKWPSFPEVKACGRVIMDGRPSQAREYSREDKRRYH